ncbi:hypothetical protein MMC08_003928 [Hypocenomyce scalaris]|nr:hypothetical protein [Hypocenomyce scalaris]
MDRLNVSKSILSITSPGTHLVPGDDTLARKVARESNVYAAELKKKYPTRFGFWASLPLPDVEGSLAEIAYSLDELDADGFTVLTNHHGIYLGDALYEPVFAELNRRKATLFIHPSGPCMAGSHQHPTPRRAGPLQQYPMPMFEFLMDTARATINLFLSGTVSRYPDVTYILSHGGGVLAPLLQRFTTFGTSILRLDEGLDATAVKALLNKQFYFDLAGFPFPDLIHGLLGYAHPSRLLYGSDYPYTPGTAIIGLEEVMDTELPKIIEDSSVIQNIYTRNAMKLLS